VADWIRLDVSFFRHPQVSRLKPAEQLGYLSMILYAQEHETDGDIHDTAMKVCGVTRDSIISMERAALVHRTGNNDGWRIVGYLNHQRSRAQMAASRLASSAGGKKAAAARWAKNDAPTGAA